MNNDAKIQELEDNIAVLKDLVIELTRRFDAHFHDGSNSQRVNIIDLAYVQNTTTVSTHVDHSVTVPDTSGVLPIQIGNTIIKLLYQ